MIPVYRAPGRVNLIGEHTDYNLGFVLPIALDLATEVGVHPPSEPGELRVTSAEEGETADWPAAELSSLTPQGDWTDYIVGVAQQLIRRGYAIEPQQLSISTEIPIGAGLSSSAALEVSVALALLNGRAIEPLELAKLCQAAEREFAGMPAGIMDQYISVFGQAHAAVRIDCRSLTHELVRLPENVTILAVDSKVKHALGQSAYRIRVQECAAAAAALNVPSLRDATLQRVQAAQFPSDAVMRRARHIVTENARVLEFVEAAGVAGLPHMGQLFYESHESMRDDYEITCEEIDFLVETARPMEGVYGARMTGGGFGGCTVNLVRPDCQESFSRQIALRYRERFGIEARIIPCVPSAGATQTK